MVNPSLKSPIPGVSDTITFNSGDFRIASKDKSFAILKMADETKLTLGPNSSIEISALSEKGKPGIISLLKGQLRSIRYKNQHYF